MSIDSGANIGVTIFKVFAYVVCIFLAVLSIFPFYIMIINATRGTYEIQSQALSLIPSTYLFKNFGVFETKQTFNAFTGFKNSMIISIGTTLFATYFSSLTAYALTAYDWRFRQPFFSFVVGVMMVPAQVSTIGFFQFVYRLNMVNSFIPLIIPSIAAPGVVFFMRQYLLATLSIDIINAARVDGAREFYTFNRIIVPIMLPAIAIQGIFIFVSSWNNFFMPLILLNDSEKYTMPIMVSLLRGDIYRTEFGAIYLALTLTVLPLFVVYFTLSRYIIAGIQLGGVKE
jgi:multiple sugar transport system permease protein